MFAIVVAWFRIPLKNEFIQHRENNLDIVTEERVPYKQTDRKKKREGEGKKRRCRILNKTDPYISRERTRVQAIVHAETASLCAAVPSPQSAYKLHIQFPNITSPHSENRGSRPAFTHRVETQAEYARKLVRARVRILLSKVYLSTVVDHGQNIHPSRLEGMSLSFYLFLPPPFAHALSNIPIVYFHAFASAKVPLVYLPSRKSRRIYKTCVKIRALQILPSNIRVRRRSFYVEYIHDGYEKLISR